MKKNKTQDGFEVAEIEQTLAKGEDETLRNLGYFDFHMQFEISMKKDQYLNMKVGEVEALKNMLQLSDIGKAYADMDKLFINKLKEKLPEGTIVRKI